MSKRSYLVITLLSSSFLGFTGVGHARPDETDRNICEEISGHWPKGIHKMKVLSDGDKRRLCCLCRPGTRFVKICTGDNVPDTTCTPCQFVDDNPDEQYFMDEKLPHNKKKCIKSKTCDNGYYRVAGNRTTDAKCCRLDSYFNATSSICIPHTKCLPGHGVIKLGDTRTDSECAPCREGYQSLAHSATEKCTKIVSSKPNTVKPGQAWTTTSPTSTTMKPTSATSTSPSSSGSVPLVVGLIGGALLVIAIISMAICYCRRQRPETEPGRLGIELCCFNAANEREEHPGRGRESRDRLLELNQRNGGPSASGAAKDPLHEKKMEAIRRYLEMYLNDKDIINQMFRRFRGNEQYLRNLEAQGVTVMERFNRCYSELRTFGRVKFNPDAIVTFFRSIDLLQYVEELEDRIAEVENRNVRKAFVVDLPGQSGKQNENEGAPLLDGRTKDICEEPHSSVQIEDVAGTSGLGNPSSDRKTTEISDELESSVQIEAVSDTSGLGNPSRDGKAIDNSEEAESSVRMEDVAGTSGLGNPSRDEKTFKNSDDPESSEPAKPVSGDQSDSPAFNGVLAKPSLNRDNKTNDVPDGVSPAVVEKVSPKQAVDDKHSEKAKEALSSGIEAPALPKHVEANLPYVANCPVGAVS